MSQRLWKILIPLMLLVTAVVFSAGAWFYLFVSTPVKPFEPEIIDISPGTPFSRVALQLEAKGIIGDAQRFVWLARWQSATDKIHAGEYLFEAASLPGDVLARLVAGDVRKIWVTIPEGFNVVEIAARIEETGIGSKDSILKLCYSPTFIQELGINAESLEGYLFPETYTVTHSTTVSQLLRAMVDQLKDHLSTDLLADAKQLNMTRHQLLTMASIIQKEAGNNEEMPMISAVFHNRLQRGMALQADPTVIYGIKNFDGNLTRKHLETPTAYNTYQKRGLPPGPIASPGRGAIYAAVYPAESSALYFVSRGDGTHQFSKTLREHNRAVRRYQLRRSD
jgi:UPF0755 protein